MSLSEKGLKLLKLNKALHPNPTARVGDRLTGNREVIKEGENALIRTDLVHINVRQNESTREYSIPFLR